MDDEEGSACASKSGGCVVLVDAAVLNAVRAGPRSTQPAKLACAIIGTQNIDSRRAPSGRIEARHLPGLGTWEVQSDHFCVAMLENYRLPHCVYGLNPHVLIAKVEKTALHGQHAGHLMKAKGACMP